MELEPEEQPPPKKDHSVRPRVADAATRAARRQPLPAPVKMIVGGAPPARGAPRRFTLDRQREYFDHLARGVSRGDAAKLVGVTRQTIKHHRDADPDFGEAEKDAEAACNEQVRTALYDAAVAGNIEAMKTWLFNRDPDNWKPAQKLQVEISGDVNHSFDPVADLQVIEELQQRLQARVLLRQQSTPELGPGVLDAEVLEDED